MERDVQYLRELAVLKVIYNYLGNTQLSKDADEVHSTQPMWWKFLWSALLSYAMSYVIASNHLERWRGTSRECIG